MQYISVIDIFVLKIAMKIPHVASIVFNSLSANLNTSANNFFKKYLHRLCTLFMLWAADKAFHGTNVNIPSIYIGLLYIWE